VAGHGATLVLRPMRAGTIVASNYSAMARVLGESFLDHHPGSTFHVLVIDELDADFGDRIQVARLADLDLDVAVLDVMKTIYDVMEFATAVKPSFLRFLLAIDAHEDAVACYLDPDIVVYANFDDVVESAATHGIVLTPHVLEPIPRDGLNASEGTIMQSGMYNCGFLAVSAAGMAFLNWWDERLRFDAVVDFENSYFTDQRWVDWVPSLFEYVICRDPGMNIAWWNIHERPVDADGPAPTVNGVPVRFIHFSGYDPTQPDVLSKHQGELPRVAHVAGTGVRTLADDYAQRLIGFGHVDRRRSEYPWNTSVQGVELTTEVRRLVRTSILAELGEGQTITTRSTPDGFGGGAVSLTDWLQPVDTAPEPSRPVIAGSPGDIGPGGGRAEVLRRSKQSIRHLRTVSERMVGRVGDRARDRRPRPDAIDGRRSFAFLHVPRSAGSSVVASLRDALDGHEWADYGCDPAWMGPYRHHDCPPSLAHQVLENRADLEHFDAVAGYFTLGTLLTRFDARDIATVVREPRCRLLSDYEYRRGLSGDLRDAELPWVSNRSAMKLDFADWLLDESIAYQSDNTLIRQLVDDPAIPDDGFIPNEQLARLARLASARLRQLGFVALVEQGDAIFEQLGTFIGAPLERRRIDVTERESSVGTDLSAIFDHAAPALAARTAGDALVWRAAAERVGVPDPEVVAAAAWMRRVGVTVRNEMNDS
jgi:hypothetical protein